MKTNTELYAQDFFVWAQTTAELIRYGQWNDIDTEALAKEIEDLSISQKHALGSHLKNLVMHLLKWCYQPQGRETGHSWETSIINARDEIAMLFEDMHSLKREAIGLLSRRYPAARRLASGETKLPLDIFPQECPWKLEDILDDNFWPNADE